jgi:hypothetical protein
MLRLRTASVMVPSGVEPPVLMATPFLVQHLKTDRLAGLCIRRREVQVPVSPSLIPVLSGDSNGAWA